MLIKLAAFLISVHHYIQDELAESRAAISVHLHYKATSERLKAVKTANAVARKRMDRARQYAHIAADNSAKRDHARELLKVLTK